MSSAPAISAVGTFRHDPNATYHMTNPADFHNKEDQWNIPSIETEPRAQPVQPYFTIMKVARHRPSALLFIGLMLTRALNPTRAVLEQLDVTEYRQNATA